MNENIAPLVPPTDDEQVQIMALSHAIGSHFQKLGVSLQVGVSAMVSTIVQVAVGDPEVRAEVIADMRHVADALEKCGDAEPEQASALFKQAMGENAFTSERPAGSVLQ